MGSSKCENRARIFQLLRSLGIDFKELIPGLLKSLKIRAQSVLHLRTDVYYCHTDPEFVYL